MFFAVPGGAIFRLDENGSKQRAPGDQVKTIFFLPKIKFGRRFSIRILELPTCSMRVRLHHRFTFGHDLISVLQILVQIQVMSGVVSGLCPVYSIVCTARVRIVRRLRSEHQRPPIISKIIFVDIAHLQELLVFPSSSF